MPCLYLPLLTRRWHKLKLSMCEALSTKKGAKTIQILQKTYNDSDVMFLQVLLLDGGNKRLRGKQALES